MIIASIIGCRVVSEKPFQRDAGTNKVTRIRVVSNPARKNDRNPGRFLNAEGWGGLGDQLAKFAKGDIVTLTGELKLDKYTTGKGEERQDDSLTVTNFQVHVSPTYFGKTEASEEPATSPGEDLPF